jgi:hypothetical protein
MEVISADPPTTIVEQNVGAKGRRVARGTYRLKDLPGGGTRIAFEYAWKQAPLSERVAAPLARAAVKRVNEHAMRRLAELAEDVAAAFEQLAGDREARSLVELCFPFSNVRTSVGSSKFTSASPSLQLSIPSCDPRREVPGRRDAASSQSSIACSWTLEI